MLFRLLSVELLNFKAYYGSHEWVLPEDPGLYYITGKNRFNRRLGSNGIGKSTLSDAINWVLYGKTSRGLRASDVIAWGKSSCTAAVSFLIGDAKHRVTRSQNPNHIDIDGNPATQDEVDKLIRLNQGALNNSMLLPQFGESFLDLTPSAKLIMFSRVMDLDFWLDRSKAADDKADQLADTINASENKAAHARGSIERLRSDIVGLRINSEKFDEEIKKEIEGHRLYIKDLNLALKQQQERFSDMEKLVSKSKQKLETDRMRCEKVIEFRNVNQRKATELQTLVKLNDRRHKELETELLTFENLTDEICPTCLQKVDKKHSQNHQLALVEKLDKLEAETLKATEQLEGVEAVINKAIGKYNGYRQRYSNLESQHNALLSKISSIRNSMYNIQNDIRNTNSSIENLKRKTNPFEGLIADNIDERKKLKKRIRQLSEEISELKIQHEANVYWVKGFKRVRLFVIEEALAALEVEVNNLLVTLGLVNWQITFDIEKENKSGGVTKGFTVLIHSPRHRRPVRFESFSGGEVQRLRLAGDLGLSNLIMEQAGFENMVEIIDEPSEHLSSEGIEDLIETLSERAEDTGRQIWLVDHCSMDSTLFAGTLRCTMSEKGHAKFRYEGENHHANLRESNNAMVNRTSERLAPTLE